MSQDRYTKILYSKFEEETLWLFHDAQHRCPMLRTSFERSTQTIAEIQSRGFIIQ